MKLGFLKLGVLGSVLTLAACSNFSAGNLFSDYTTQHRAVYQAVKQGQYKEAQEKQSDSIAGDILDNMERGRVDFLAQDYGASKKAFEASDRAVRTLQDKAIISVSESATSIGSLAVNDNLNTYEPPDYELGFLHLYLGLNYLQRNNVEGALVEMRRANQVQEAARRKRESDLQAAQEKMQKSGMSANLGSVLANYPNAGKTLESVQNGYLFFLSGLLYEVSNDLNDAYVDYRRALAVSPNNRQVIERTISVARRLGMRQDLDLLVKRYGDIRPTVHKGQGRIIVIEERGVVQAMQSWRMDLPIFSRQGSNIYSIALPYYGNPQGKRPAPPEPPLKPLTINAQKTEPNLLMDVNLMAEYDLRERLPGLILRQALRVLAKSGLRENTTSNGDVGNLVFNVWNVLTEQADTRSWQTLPGKVYTFSETVGAGQQQMQIGDKTYQFNVPDQQTTLVWVSRQGNNSTVWHKQLGSL